MELGGTIVRQEGSDDVYSVLFDESDAFSDSDAKYIAMLPELEVLRFGNNTYLTDKLTPPLAELRNLRILDLSGANIGDAGLEYLSGMMRLRHLYLFRTRITDEGLASLTGLENLEVLNLWDTPITDAGLQNLVQMKNLRKLCLGNSAAGLFEKSKVTPEAVEKLSRQLEHTHVVYWSDKDDTRGPTYQLASVPDARFDGNPRLPASRGPAEVENIATRRHGVDWPSFLGPTGNGQSPETGLAADWRVETPRVVWHERAGEGYSAPSVSGGRLFLFDRINETNRLRCMNAETGALLWNRTFPTVYADNAGYGNGPRSTPIVDRDRVYVLSPSGMLRCLSVVDGTLHWSLSTAQEFAAPAPMYGAGTSPVVEGDLLYLIVGGTSRRGESGWNEWGVVAFDKFTGGVVSSITTQPASYASPLFADIGDRRWCFVFGRDALVGFDPVERKVDFEFPWRARASGCVNAANPVVVNDEVFVTEALGPGSALLRVEPGGYHLVWKDPVSRNKAMQSHWNTPIHHEGYLYGCSGRHSRQGELRCVAWKTGKVMWSEPKKARSSLAYMDGHFIAIHEFGVIELFRANPRKFESLGQFKPGVKIDGRDVQLLNYPAWPAPVISHGLLYLRGADRLLCLEVVSE